MRDRIKHEELRLDKVFTETDSQKRRLDELEFLTHKTQRRSA
jgi:hypothetical protein